VGVEQHSIILSPHGAPPKSCRELFHLFRSRCGRASAIRSPWSAARIWNAANTRGLAPAFTTSIKHRVHFGISWHAPKMSEAIAPERASYRVAHGLLMFVAFGILFPIGGFLAQNGSIKCDDTALLCIILPHEAIGPIGIVKPLAWLLD
jgi:hypothetical protein